MILIMRYISQRDVHLPRRAVQSRKGDNGRILIIGGSDEYVGAPALAGIAALRSGVEMGTVAAPEKVGWAISRLTPDLVVRKLHGRKFSMEHIKTLIDLEKKSDVVLIGNGMGLQPAFVRKYVLLSEKPLVIDADALKVIRLEDVNNAILTPHKREFEILLNSRTDRTVRNIRKNVIILKGPVDEIITERGTYYNKTGNAGMTKAGTGDVLAGAAAGFYAQTGDAIRAAKLAAYYTGLAGDNLRRKKGYTFLASELAQDLGRAGRWAAH